MMKSAHYDLRLPERDDQYNIDDFDDNFTAIDLAMNDIDGRLVSTSNGLADLKETDRKQHDESTRGIRDNSSEIAALKAAFEDYKHEMEKTIEGLSVELKHAQEDISCPVPIKGIYVQFPQQEAPEDLWPTSTWQLLNYDGAFFRAHGGNAATFIDKNGILTKQAESVSNLGYMKGVIFTNSRTAEVSGQFSISDRIGTLHYGSSGTGGYNFDVSLGKGNEIRPQNYTIRVWKRTA